MRVGILGYGNVGSGVKEVIDTVKDKYAIEIVKIFDRPEKKAILKDLYCESVDDIIYDNSVNVIIEVLGGDEFAYQAIKKALLNKKHVITSNKEVVSRHLNEFVTLAHINNVMFLFEAAVGGGIPIVHSLMQNVKINNVNHIYGILNGTTNFIITQMENGLSFDEALLKAQQNGFTEADPSADLEGFDLIRKIAILSDIAYNTFVDISNIPHIKISSITKEIIEKADFYGYKVKYLAESYRDTDEIYLTVEPVLIDKNNPLVNVRYEYNAVTFTGDMNGTLQFYGLGAGKLPTASAIISDLMKIIENEITFDSYFNNRFNILEYDKREESYFVYTEKEISADLVLSKDGSFYLTKKLDGKSIKEIKDNAIFIARVFK